MSEEIDKELLKEEEEENIPTENEEEKKTLTPQELQLREDLKEYYQDYFDMNLLNKVLRNKPFDTREFAFIRLDRPRKFSWVRNKSFDKLEYLHKYLSLFPIGGVYIGALYDEPLKHDRTINNTAWKGRELLFDLDINDYDTVRTCHKGREVCENCWGLMQEAALVIDDTLRIDFGFKDLVWVYTGGRGYHCWVLDKQSFGLSRDQRSAIIGYMQLIVGEEIKDVENHDTFMRSRILRHLSERYILNTPETILQDEAGFGPTTVKKAKENIAKFSEAIDIAKLIPEMDTYLPQLIKNRYPRIDQGVTMDTKKVIRMPGGIHLGTKNVTEIINNPGSFNPINDATTMYDILGKEVLEV